MDYLQLVNETIKESGVSLDSLSSSDFATTTDHMKIKFKSFVAQSWREIQMERGHWEYMTKEGVAVLSPRFYVELGDRATAPAAGYTYMGVETGTEFEIVATTTLEGTWAGADAKAHLDVLSIVGTPKINEAFDELTPTIANTDAFTLRDWGSYDMSEFISDFSQPQLDSVFIQSTGGSTVQTNSADSDMRKIRYIPWSLWTEYCQTTNGTGRPEVFTETPDGSWAFWPRLDKQYLLKTTYSIAPGELSLYSDTPASIPAQYHHAIVWRAVMLWAQYDSRPQDEMRAFKNYRFYKRQMDRYLKPGFSWAESKYNG